MQCEKCKAELTEEQSFCPFCGAEVAKNGGKIESFEVPCDEQKTVVCEVCGTESAPNATFCAVCGNRLAKKENAQLNNRFDGSYISRSAKTNTGLPVKETVKKSIIVLVSLAILIFAFLPVVSFRYNVDVLEIKSFDIKLSAIDCIGLCFDSMKSLDEEELQDSDYYEELENIREDLSDDLSKDEQKEVCGKFALYLLKLVLSSEDAPFRVVYLISLVLVFALILFALATVVLSVTDLVLFILKKDIPVLFKIVKNILSLLPAFMILLLAAITYSYLMDGTDSTFSLTESGVLIIVLSVCALAYLAIDRIFFSGEVKVNVKEIVCRSLSSVFACVLLFTMFMPAISFNVKTVFDGKTKAESASVDFDPSYFGSFDMTEEYLDEYKDMKVSIADSYIKSEFESLGGYTKKEFSRGESNNENKAILNIAFLGYGGTVYAGFVAMIPIICLLIGAIAVILIWQNLIATADGASPRGSLTVTVRIIAIVLAVAAIALTAVFAIISNFNLSEVDLSGYFGRGHSASVSLNAGTIVALIFSIASLCVPMGKRDKEKHIEEC